MVFLEAEYPTVICACNWW